MTLRDLADYETVDVDVDAEFLPCPVCLGVEVVCANSSAPACVGHVTWCEKVLCRVCDGVGTVPCFVCQRNNADIVTCDDAACAKCAGAYDHVTIEPIAMTVAGREVHQGRLMDVIDAFAEWPEEKTVNERWTLEVEPASEAVRGPDKWPDNDDEIRAICRNG